jgi:hypothetical protein
MFTITTDWLFTANQDIASRFIWSRKKKMSPAYVRWAYSKLAINDNEQEAAWEVSMTFLADIANAFEGKTFEDEQKAMNYVFRSFQKWFWKKIERTPHMKNHFVSIDQVAITTGEDMTKDRLEEMKLAMEFAEQQGEDAVFYLRYSIMTREEQGQYWDKKSITFNGKSMSHPTFYGRLSKFRAACKKYVRGEELPAVIVPEENGLVKVKGYDRYYVSREGEVFSQKPSGLKKMKPSLTGAAKCYPTVVLSKSAKPKCFLVHRLVAEAFLPDFVENKQVDHIDRNPQNNNVSNLRMVTAQENCWNRGKKINK